MNRRDAVSRVALLLGATVIGADFFLSGCKLSNKEEKKGNPLDFTRDDIAYLNEIAEIIIPTTDTPGAKAANVGEFMTVMVRDSYDEKQQKSFIDGMKKIEESSQKKFSKSYMKLSPEQRMELLKEWDADMKKYMSEEKESSKLKKEIDKLKKDSTVTDTTKLKELQAKLIEAKKSEGPHFFMLMKQLTMLGYFTSEIGMKQAQRYEPVPGKFIGDYPYKKGDKAFAG
ncbi:MAG: gluconate 2-dehydrogenase subunit 3 family protein [Chitinophagaceae bacterium]|nr:gluconate 2-dehydrogenase subunit 3 family protein [Chitinophagaceae bacterium]